MQKHPLLKILSGSLLISGTCIGAGILALPAATGEAGFVPACIISFICWAYMFVTGIFFLEATLWMKDGANVISISSYFLGKWGRLIAGSSFIFLYYCLLVSYISGAAPIWKEALMNGLHLSLETSTACCLFALIFGTIVFLGTRVIDRVNWLLMSGLILSYFLLIGVGQSEIKLSFLQRESWKSMFFATPVLFGAYGYHNIIPSVSTYLKRNRSQLRLAILFGTLLPFMIYIIWQWLIIGSITPEKLAQADSEGIPISQTLHQVTGHPWVNVLALYFGLFALITSFLGVSLSLVDFLGDGLKWQKRTGKRRLLLCLVIFLPTTLFAVENPGIFITAMGVAGGYGEAILNGILPIALVWVGCYRMNLSSDLKIPAGRLTLFVLIAFSLLIMGIETYLLLSHH